MSRWVIAIALTWSAWAVPQPAVAHARLLLSSELGPAMCGEGSQTVLLDELPLGRALSLGPLPADDRATDSVAVVDNEDDSPPAWCISPDDPRCAPRDQSAPLDGPRAHVPVQVVTAMRWPELAAESRSGKRHFEQLGAPSAGVGLRIERPPRG